MGWQVVEIGEWRGRMEIRMDRVEAGVSNFIAFQKDMRDFVSILRENERHRTMIDGRRSKIHFALLTLLCGLIIALFTVVLQHYSEQKSNSVIPNFSEMQDAKAPIRP